MGRYSISFVLPMYNELEYIHKTINISKTVLSSITDDYEIIIVDDASNDGSEIIAVNMAKDDHRIKVIRHNKNRKLGGVLKTGFYNASKDIIIYTDMDMPFDFKLLPNILPEISNYDILLGIRKGKRESFRRLVYSFIYNHLINILFCLQLRDINFSLKIFRRIILDNIELKSEGSFINAEFLIKAKRLGYSMKEIDVDYQPRLYGRSRLSSLSVIFKILYEMAKFYFEIKTFSYSKIVHLKLKRTYQNLSFLEKLYLLLRIKTCPFEEILKYIPSKGKILDLGCGIGILFHLLSLKYDTKDLTFIGIDLDTRKLNTFGKSINNKNIELLIGDINKIDFFSFNNINCITLIDVLYYLKYEQKDRLLKQCFNILDKGGILVIKDIDKDCTLKFLWTFIQEYFMVKIFHITNAKGLYFERKKKLVELLKENGFDVEFIDLSKGYIYSHLLYVCYKK